MNEADHALHWFLAWGRAARFAFAVVAAVLSPKLYTPRARAATARQVYFTAWQVLPGFTLFATLLGIVVVEITLSAARQFALEDYALELIFRALVLELMPLLTALFVALRSGSAISAEIAMMRIAGDFDDLASAGIEPFEKEFVPRVAASAASVFALTTLACVFVVALSYLLMYGPSPWGFEPFTRTIARVFTPLALGGLGLKCMAFGAVVAVIPISAGLDATRDARSVPIAVMGGMVRLFFALGLIEIFALALKYV
ncbi:MAG TPA: ABC transporter permease [Burkholderiales bacterium]|nr:ABC transporter permease [Burkholderiales bacterium]